MVPPIKQPFGVYKSRVDINNHAIIPYGSSRTFLGSFWGMMTGGLAIPSQDVF